MPDPTARSDDFVDVTGGSLFAVSQATGGPEGAPVPLGADPCVIGRGSGCQIVVDDREASLSHCELVATATGLRVKDLGSTNGTFIGQVRIDSGGAVFLIADARLRCGQTWFQLRVAASERVPIAKSSHFGALIGRSEVMRRIYAQLARIAPHDLNVLITGETGTGKELVARAIHDNSRRASGPFVTIDCANIPATLVESKLFGHEKGSFTGAVSRHLSPLVEAKGGTIFFDELGELPLELQPKLLRALEAREIQPVGSNRYVPIDVRVVAATHRNLHAEINAQRFRNDLYYRFAQAVIQLPPLRERTEDIPDLALKFFTDLGDPTAMTRLDRPARDRLMRHDWPGNVRQLRSAIFAAHALSQGGPIEMGDPLDPLGLARTLSTRGHPPASFEDQRREILEAFEREYFTNLYAQTGGNFSEMSRGSGIPRTTLLRHLTRCGLRASE